MSAATTYDELPYTNNPFYYTHPSNLAVLPSMLGMRPAPVDRCRVLDMGCGLGGNLVPMAELLPDSRFVGIDLSARQIEAGQEAVRALGLTNIELKALSIGDIDTSFGEFDYIICHGVYSWVPAAVQQAILRVCKQNLAPAGVAYVSYNCYPGWHFRGMIREMMQFHVRQFDQPGQKIQQARALMSFLVKAVARTRIYSDLMKLEAGMLEHHTDTYLFHEYLEEVNQPLYFHQFAERAQAVGLQYVGEATNVPLPQNLDPDVLQTLEDVATDLVHAEQYLDFLRNRFFRRTLLCHDDVKLQRPLSPAAIMSTRVSTLVRPERTDTGTSFSSPDGPSLTTNHPLLVAALTLLHESHPCSLTFAELWDRTRARLQEQGLSVEGWTDPQALAEPLMQCALSDLVELHAWEPPLVMHAAQYPRATLLARLQAANDVGVTNLRHRKVKLENLDRFVLAHLDGTRDREALLSILKEAAAKGALGVDGQADVSAERLREALEGTLNRLGRGGYLMA
jgi:methyltransferase-like protein/2-polyprenyl-3-methyl-5-hydroxy-6-metoxy-1,4-benzoquinol methylase